MKRVVKVRENYCSPSLKWRVSCIEFIWAEGWIRLDAPIYFVKQFFYLVPITCGRKLVETKMGNKLKNMKLGVDKM